MNFAGLFKFPQQYIFALLALYSLQNIKIFPQHYNSTTKLVILLGNPGVKDI